MGEPHIRSILPGEDDWNPAQSHTRQRPGLGDGEPDRRARTVVDGTEEADRVIEFDRRAGAGSIAVLVRSRAHLIEIVDALKRRASRSRRSRSISWRAPVWKT